MAGTQVLKLSGARHLRTAVETQDSLVQALVGGCRLILDLGEVDEADLTFVQLIIAARHSAEAKGVPVTLSAPSPSPVMEVLERGGFIGPAPDERRNFWLAA